VITKSFSFGKPKPSFGDQNPTPRARCGSWKQVSRVLLCRAKYGGGLVPPSIYGNHEGLLRTPKMPGQRGSGEARRANHPPSGYKEITETIGNTPQSHLSWEERMSPQGLHSAPQRKLKGGRDADPPPYSQGHHIVWYMECQDHV